MDFQPVKRTLLTISLYAQLVIWPCEGLIFLVIAVVALAFPGSLDKYSTGIGLLAMAAACLTIFYYFADKINNVNKNELTDVHDIEKDNQLKNIERIVEQWDLDNVTFCPMTPEIKPELIEYIENEMKETSTSYFSTTLDFIKWNTAFAIAAILWFGNYLITAITDLNPFQSSLAVFTLLLFVCSIAWSIGFFYYVSRYLNKHWILMSEWRESLVSAGTGGHASTSVAQGLINHYQNLPKDAKSFDTALIGQWVLLCLGFGSFIVFIINLKI